MAATDKTNVTVGVEVLVDGIFLGSPKFTIGEDGNIKSNPIRPIAQNPQVSAAPAAEQPKNYAADPYREPAA